MSLIAARDDESFRVRLQMFQKRREKRKSWPLFGGLIKNGSFFIQSSRFFSLALAEFIHSCPIFSSMKISQLPCCRHRNGRELFGNETFFLSRLPYFFLWLLFPLTRAHTSCWAGPQNPLPHFLWLLFFIQLFPTWIFIEENFPFCVARLESFFHDRISALFTRFSMIPRVRRRTQTISPSRHWESLTNLPFCLIILPFDCHFFLPFSYITAFSLENVEDKLFHKFHALDEPFLTLALFPLDSHQDFPEKKKIFSFNKTILCDKELYVRV